MCNTIKLRYGAKGEENYVYRREGWPKSTPSFGWNTHHQEYRYISGTTVGETVLGAGDLVMIRLPEQQQQQIEGVSMRKDVNYIGTGYSVVEVSYELDYELSLSTYYFKTSIKALAVGDLVVVESKQGLGLVRVVATPIERSLDTEIIGKFNQAKAWVVNKVDTAMHDQRREATERKKFIMEQLAERREAMEEVAIYKILAASDPDAAKLLEELEGLS